MQHSSSSPLQRYSAKSARDTSLSLTQSAAPVDRDGIQQTTYSALLIIILAFIAGAFLRGEPLSNAGNENQIVGESDGEGAPAQKIYDGEDALAREIHLVGALGYDSLFTTDGSDLREAELAALLSLVKSHDLYVELTVFGGAPGEDIDAEKRLERAVARAYSLQEHFWSHEIDPELVRISAEDGPSFEQVRLRIFGERA